MDTNTLPVTLLVFALLLVLALFVRLRREHEEAFNELPTGVCAVGAERIEHWNRVMAALTGIRRQDALGLRPEELPEPWAQALTDVLAEPMGSVIKRAVDAGTPATRRWIMLHSSAARATARHRLVIIEDITEQQQLQDELLHKERLASIGRLAAGIAHEIGNPVTGIACVAQNLREDPAERDVEDGAAEILKQTRRVSRTLSALMQLSHPGSAERDAECHPCNLADCIDEAIHLLQLNQRATPCRFDNLCDRELLAMADSQHLLQVFLNLLDNARRAADGAESVIIDAHTADAAVFITIDNAGPAVPDQVLSQAFEPFFTTRDVGDGTGLGLALVRRMVEDMGGTIRLVSPSPRFPSLGARAEVRLPSTAYGDTYGEQL